MKGNGQDKKKILLYSDKNPGIITLCDCCISYVHKCWVFIELCMERGKKDKMRVILKNKACYL